MTIAGRDVREYRQEDVRRMFALAGQGAHLFASTIRENLRLARPAADDDELRRPFGGRRSASGSPRCPTASTPSSARKATALGRAAPAPRPRPGAARRRPVLVLDEPTAHLDPATARSLMNDVLDAATGRPCS